MPRKEETYFSVELKKGKMVLRLSCIPNEIIIALLKEDKLTPTSITVDKTELIEMLNFVKKNFRDEVRKKYMEN